MLLDRRGYGFILGKFHGKDAPALGQRPQDRGISEHLGQRGMGFDNARSAAHLQPLDLAPPGVEVTDDVAQVFVRSDDLEAHNRFEQGWFGLAGGVFEGQGGGDLESQGSGIGLTERTAGQSRPDIRQGKTGQQADIERFADPVFDGRDELGRDLVRFGLVDEDEALAARKGLKPQLAMSIHALPPA